MIKMLVIGLSSFVVALAASTAVVVMRAPPPPPRPAAASPASAPRPAAAPAPAAADSAATPPASAARAAQAPDAAGDVGPQPAQTVSAAPAATPATIVVGPIDRTTESYRQMARILGNMKPKDAVRIMAFMSDDQVEGILRSLGVRTAATLLAQFPTERAAVLGKRLMNPPAGAGK